MGFNPDKYRGITVEMVHWRPNREKDLRILDTYTPDELAASDLVNERIAQVLEAGGIVAWVDDLFGIQPQDGEILVGGASLDACVNRRVSDHLRFGNVARIDYNLAIRRLLPFERKDPASKGLIWGPRKK